MPASPPPARTAGATKRVPLDQEAAAERDSVEAAEACAEPDAGELDAGAEPVNSAEEAADALTLSAEVGAAEDTAPAGVDAPGLTGAVGLGVGAKLEPDVVVAVGAPDTGTAENCADGLVRVRLLKISTTSV